MRLGIDLDGVVANFTKGWLHFYNRDFGTELVRNDVRNWADPVDLTHFADMREFWDWARDLDGHTIFWHLEPYPDTVPAIQSLAQDGHEVVVLTTKPRFAVEDTHAWIERVGMPATEIHTFEGSDKWTVECDVYLDDSPHVLPRLLERRPEATVCRYLRPWNRPLEGAVDVSDFSDFRAVVDRLTESS